MTKSFVWIAIFLILAIMASCGVALTHAKTTSGHPNSLGVVVGEINPNTSLVASIIGGLFVHDRDGRTATALRVHPKGMYALFDEMILFCGMSPSR
jgi:hypothetical protein